MAIFSRRLAFALPVGSLLAGLVTVTACTGDDASPPSMESDAGGADANADSTPTPANPVPPDAPTAVAAMVDLAKGAHVTWTPPTSSGTSPIKSYTVKTSPGDMTVTTSGPVTSATVLGLTPGTAYTFTVVATNDTGDSPPSAPSAPVTAVDGLTPTTLSACSGTKKVTLDASAVAGATATNVYFGTAPGVTRANGTKIAGITFPYLHTTGTADTTYYYVFTAVDGAGIESVESNEISATARNGLADVAFATSYSSAKITIFDCFSQRANGAGTATRTITGDTTQIKPNPYGNIFVDATARRIYAMWTDRVTVWDDADTVDGNVAPTRTLTGASAGVDGAYGIVVDRKRDRLYLGLRSGSILVWANASTVTGDIAPTATISGASTTLGSNVVQIAIDEAGDRLYVSNSPATTAGIVVFDNVSTLAGANNIAPSRTISVAGWSTRGVAIDPAHDLLYVGSRESPGAIYTIANASTANGAVTALHKFGLSASQIMTVQAFGDSVAAFEDSAKNFLVWNNAKDVDGATAPSRTVGNDTTNGAGFFIVP